MRAIRLLFVVEIVFWTRILREAKAPELEQFIIPCTR